MLFIAHRKTILQKSKEAYENILRNKKIVIYGDEEVEGADVVFAMIQTLSKENHLAKFSPDYFDYIVIDEVHHGGAKSYQAVINYFTSKFLLGMTATPERGDNFDIYSFCSMNCNYKIFSFLQRNYFISD